MTKRQRYTNFPNILSLMERISNRYNPEHDRDEGHAPIRWETNELLYALAKLVYEVIILERRVYRLEKLAGIQGIDLPDED